MKLIAVTMGTSLAIHLGMGMATGYSLGFLALTLLYAAAGFGMLQMYLKYGDGDHVSSFQHGFKSDRLRAMYFIFGAKNGCNNHRCYFQYWKEKLSFLLEAACEIP